MFELNVKGLFSLHCLLYYIVCYAIVKRKGRMDKANKNCCVRMPENLHRQAKLQAFKEGKNLQLWIAELILERLNSLNKKPAWKCQICGRWDLQGTQMAKIGKCESCKKGDVATFPCDET